MYIVDVRNGQLASEFQIETLEDAIEAAIGQAKMGEAIQEKICAFIYSTRLAPQFDESHYFTGMEIEEDRILAVYEGSKIGLSLYWTEDGEQEVLDKLVADKFKEGMRFPCNYEHLYYEMGFDHMGVSILKNWQKEALRTTEVMDNHRDIIFIKIA